MRTIFILCFAVLLACPIVLAAQEEDRWEETIQGFEQRDAESPPPQNEIVFVGSSSIRFWKTDTDFPDLTIINRGFGGSETSDALRYASRIVIPYAPRLVVLYAGDNDIARGKSSETVLADTSAFVNRIHEALPEARIVYLSIKPSLLRWNMVVPMREANAKIHAYAETRSFVDYVDLDTPMIGEDGKPRKELFIKDGLHLSRAGYDLWNRIVRPYLVPNAE